MSAVAALALLPCTAVAFDFKPTPLEWATWPDFCKARYVTVPIGQKSPYRTAVPPAAIETWRNRLGNKTFTHVHHYCASLVYVQRANSAPSNQERNHLLKMAEGDCHYTLSRIPPTSPLYRDVAGHLQLVRILRGTATGPGSGENY
jgi:hypothetical protein